VQVQVASILGNSMLDIKEDNILNQTLTFDLDVVPGIYIFRIRIGGELYVVKQFMQN
jgi:hypothetical protein